MEKEYRCSKESEIEKIKVHVDSLTKEVEIIDKKLFGNGDSGMLEKMAESKKEISNIKIMISDMKTDVNQLKRSTEDFKSRFILLLINSVITILLLFLKHN